jgi:hypothetical protein
LKNVKELKKIRNFKEILRKFKETEGIVLKKKREF